MVRRAVRLRGGLSHPVVAELRRVRRHHRVVEVDWIDALYRAYLTAIVSGIAVVVLSGVVGDHRLAPHAVHRALVDGPAVVGLVLAVAVAVGIRSGGRGGALALVGWSTADVAAGVATSPFTLLGRLALWPLHVDLTALVGVAVALALPMLGLIVIGGLSLEAAERRASLVAQLRFAVTLQDL